MYKEKVHVEVLSPSNVLSNYSQKPESAYSRINSYLSADNYSPLQNNFFQNSSTVANKSMQNFYSYQKVTSGPVRTYSIQKPIDSEKTRGISNENHRPKETNRITSNNNELRSPLIPESCKNDLRKSLELSRNQKLIRNNSTSKIKENTFNQENDDFLKVFNEKNYSIRKGGENKIRNNGLTNMGNYLGSPKNILEEPKGEYDRLYKNHRINLMKAEQLETKKRKEIENKTIESNKKSYINNEKRTIDYKNIYTKIEKNLNENEEPKKQEQILSDKGNKIDNNYFNFSIKKENNKKIAYEYKSPLASNTNGFEYPNDLYSVRNKYNGSEIENRNYYSIKKDDQTKEDDLKNYEKQQINTNYSQLVYGSAFSKSKENKLQNQQDQNELKIRTKEKFTKDIEINKYNSTKENALNNDDFKECQKLQEKLNSLEKKILSLKSTYESNKRTDNKSGSVVRKSIKKDDEKEKNYISSSYNFSQIPKEEDPANYNSNQNTFLKPQINQEKKKSKINSVTLEKNNLISNSNNSNFQSTQKNDNKKPDIVLLKNYVTQVHQHSILPDNVPEETINKKIPKQHEKNENKNTNKSDHMHLKRSESMQNNILLKKLINSDFYYIGSVVKAFQTISNSESISAWREHFAQTMQAVLFSKFLKPNNEDDISEKQIMLSKKEKDKKTIIFDLDETLIHCNENSDMEADIILPIQFPNGLTVEAGINVRPYTRECLKELNKHYEIIVFTASHSCYANVVLNFLDPQKEFIQHRLSRENCVLTKEGLYIKDLRILKNRDLKDVLIVDNAAYSFGFQLDNGIPILPFYKNKNDWELKSLTNYLVAIKDVKDIRNFNMDMFKLNKFEEFNDPSQLIKELYKNYIKE